MLSRKKSNYLEAYQIRTQVYIALQRYQEALDDSKRALRYKEDALNFYNLARVYESLELYDEAQDAYQKSIGKNNNMEEVHLSLANLAFRLNKFDLAMASVNQVLRINSRNKEALMLRSSIHAEK
jgi:tetratricopeptide (TPR) repeat protein